VALLGALVMPYNIFLQSAVINGRHRGAVDSDDRKANMLKVDDS
jgi:Mn2+/Fe2+ NRAMP family transporter